MKRGKLKTQHSSDQQFLAYCNALDAIATAKNPQAREEARAKAYAMPGLNMVVLGAESLKEIACSGPHLKSILQEDRATFTRADPDSYAMARAIGEEIYRAAGIAGLRLCIAIVQTPDSRDQVWIATAWNGICKDWTFDEVDTRPIGIVAEETKQGEIH